MRWTLPDIPDDISLAGKTVAGKTVMVVGGKSGLGLEFVRQALMFNASQVIITARIEAKGRAAMNDLCHDPEIRAINPKAKLGFLELDLDDYDSASTFLQAVNEEVPELDVLLCNAGVNLFNYQTSKTGHERVMQVNCYTHLLIVLGLLPLLQVTATKRGSPSRVTFVSSFSHTKHTIQASSPTGTVSILKSFDDKAKYRGTRRYQDSKLVVNALVQRLATVVPSSEVTVNAVCPGVVATDLNRNLPWWLKIVMSIYMMIHAKSAGDGAWVLFHAAVATGPESHGKYLQMGELHAGTPFLNQPAGKEFTEKLWAELIAEFRKIRPELGIYA